MPDKEESKFVLTTTVADELKWIGVKLASAIDISHQVDQANMAAQADLVLEEGGTLLRNVPATTLLEMEKRIVEVQDLVQAIPTLDPAKAFEPDPNRGPGIFRARDVTKPKTEKVFKFVVMTPTTDKLPAQIEKYYVDTPVGETVTQEWSSLITVAEKARMLDRSEELLRAIRTARSRANQIEGGTGKIGATLLDYVFNGVVS